MKTLTDIAHEIMKRNGSDNAVANLLTRSQAQALVDEAIDNCEKVLDDLYKHDRKSSGYDEGWNDALGVALATIEKLK